MARGVRRGFRCGEDHVNGKNFAHRKQWIVDLLNELTNIISISLTAYAVMFNHYHVVQDDDIGIPIHLNNYLVLMDWMGRATSH